MIQNITVGRFYQGDSILHRLDPRVKLTLTFVYMIAIFLLNTWQSLSAALVVVAFLCFLSRIPFRIILKSVKPIIFLLVFVMIINTFSIRTGPILWQWSFIQITTEGLFRAVLMTARLFLLIVSTSLLLTLTTTPLLMAGALESLFSPLKKFRVPVHEMAMMMAIALRFVPTLVEETDKIMKAQASRGAEYDTGNLLVRIRGYITVLVPLFVSAFKRAEELAIAMDARCYQGGEGRTRLHVLTLQAKDILWLAILSGLALGLIALDFYGKMV